MAEILVANSFEISLLRIVAFAAAIIIVVLLCARELPGLVRQGRGWVHEQERLSRRQTGYVAPTLGRGSTLLGGCTLVFNVFRGESFSDAGARGIATLLSSISVAAGCLIGLTMLAITSEIVAQTRRGE